MSRGLRTWIEVSRGALQSNYDLFRSLAPEKRLLAIVKSNAYGHGLWDAASAFESFGADFFGADSIAEALTLRERGITRPILVLGYTLPARLSEAAEGDISVTISCLPALQQALRLQNGGGRPLKIHLKIDTGMHRQGFLVLELPQAIRFLKRHRLTPLEVEGIYTHCAAAVPSRARETHEQIAEFKKAVSMIEAAGFRPIRHMAATSATLAFPETHFDMVRVGMGLYGHAPSDEMRGDRRLVALEPAFSWRAIVSEVKAVPRGAGISYDWTEGVARPSRIAVVPVGYWHGFPRALSGRASVLVRGRRAKVLGRVCMDMIIIDVTDVPRARQGDVVTLVGREGKAAVTAEELAELVGTSSYEILTRSNPLIERVYGE